MNYYEQAAERLRKESTSVTGAKASAMKAAVRDALLQFAKQDEEFAQAIVQGGSFKDCMEAEKDYKKKIADLNSQIKLAAATKEQYEKEIRELSVKAESADKAGAESKQLRDQIKDLQGQLTLASPEVAAFKAAFDRAQAELVTMLKALHKVQDPEIKAKLSTAARTVLENFAGQIEG